MQLKEGTKFDEGKLRYELVPPEALEALVSVLTAGAVKYDARNWERGIAYSRVFGALHRHLWAWWAGQSIDSESNFSHLWHALCCLGFLVTYEMRGMHEFDDRPRLPVTSE